MTAASIANFALLFLAIGFAATFLMYYLWGFPFDKERNKSEAPRWAMYLHRGLGYAFLLIYIGLMWHMIPRMWEYQVEFPARTVAHIILGLTVGFLLLIKIAIMRFFRHFEEWMPYLGTAIMLCTVLMLGLSVPFVFQERALADRAPGGSAFSAENQVRVKRRLGSAGFPQEAPMAQLASVSSLKRGRRVLLSNCVKCHDLRTVILKPRSPSNWYKTVVRMGDKPALFDPIKEADQWRVTAYLIAITPRLQKSRKRIRAQAAAQKSAAAAAAKDTVAVPGGGDGGPEAGKSVADETFDPKKAKAEFEEVCGDCHDTSDVDDDPPKTRKDVDTLVQRMIEENDMEATGDQLKMIKWYLNRHYVENKGDK